MPWWRLHYHLIWTTRQREPLIDAPREQIVRSTLQAKARALGLVLHAIGGIEDHIHVVVSIPPAVTVAACVKHFKGATSRRVNQMFPAPPRFAWQAEYGAVTLGERSLPRAIDYVQRQRQHHRVDRLIEWYETVAAFRPA